MAGKKYTKLKTPRDVSKFISRLINQVNRGGLDTEKARTLGYLCKILIDSLEKTELQNEIERIKEKLGMSNEPESRTEAH